MELRQLEAFAAVMSTGSITAAGRLLSRPQPAVTRLIQQLEAEVGYELFVRNGPRVSPSEKGYQLYQEVEPALLSLRQVRERAREIEQAKMPAIRIAATPALAAGLLPLALAEWGHKDVGVKIRSLSPERVVQAVQTGMAHLGLNSLPLEHQGLNLHWLGEAACIMAVHKNDPLAGQKRIRLADCQGRRLITFENPYRTSSRVRKAFADAKLSFDALIESNASINVLMAVHADLGIALLDPPTAYSIPLPDVVLRPTDVSIPFAFGTVTSMRMAPMKGVAELVEAIAVAARKMIPDFRMHDPQSHSKLLGVFP